MLYLIGLGLGLEGISSEGLEIAKRCKAVYLENYTIEFPYSTKLIEEIVGKKIKMADRTFIESLEIVDEAQKKDVALLIYGSPLTATTHIVLIEECKKSEIKCRVIYAGSVFDSVPECGLQIYKFGKIASMPKWIPDKKFEPESFMEIVKENKTIGAHSLILCDIGLEIGDAVRQLQIAAARYNFKNIGRIVVCSRLGTRDQHIWYDFVEKFENKKIRAPYCIIIPGKLHFMEEEILKEWEVRER